MSPRSLFLAVAAGSLSSLVSSQVTDPNAICYSYGVDYMDEGNYFINSLSNEDFAAVSYFKGCNGGKADVLLVAPEEAQGETEFLCSQIPTTPDEVNQLSTCPIEKSQMQSGHWLLLVIGNNGKDGQPFAWQRDLYLTVGPQATSTYTPTITMTITSIPTQTKTDTTTFTDVMTTGPFSTVTVPSGTAKRIKTITPKAVTATSTKTMTRTKVSLTKVVSITTKTVQATCTTPAHTGRPDKPCTYSPTKIHPAALVTPTTIPTNFRWARKADREVDIEWARARIEAAKRKRDQAKAPLERRAPDAPTITVTGDTPASTTTTEQGPPTTTTETVLVTEASTYTIPAPTVLSGLITLTTTLPTPTKTRITLAYTTTTKTINFGATYTKTSTITPSASVTACKSQGGHWWS
ncbi:hypothetical protein CFE70_001860 [Pyrenophora teres f. teres 0-1]|uniref:Uncharacterized protein n=2 Tax=Pyrenophora teres f. teres TaxID=97479 RepID=E3S335_PYRTT|nr:hypothetical protein PTT_16823 [Pyrenophora teres f. teres 0-1]KAE8842422.1 hypothetical protein HRS9139_01719 [Pyrenophora teres f. teres]KAE8850516.1 hypothetical protein PTNB85_00932 [Pyrenophora teres f. teres]KAE8851459.1 hypothetical protein HRS9122_01746 [Pyrenophora teres f. teres]KAE8870122.1 hypothetical protein PTNB29_00466 [Pyrenophora teres f. teres]